MTKDILILVSLLLLSGFFSASETALVSLSPAKVRTMVEEKARFSNLVAFLKDRPHQLLITILVGNNLVNIGASVYSTIVFQKILGNAALGIITGVLTLFILVFGEIVPKSFAQAYSKGVSRMASPILYAFYWVFWPVVFIMDLLVKGLLHLSPNNDDEQHVTEEELKAFVSIGAEDGAIEDGEKTLIENVLEFNDTRAEDIMVPRVDIQGLPCVATLADAATFVDEHHHSRIPVYEGSIDNITGILTVKTLLQYLNEGKGAVVLKDLKLMKPFKVPISKKINQLFKEFQKRRTHIAIVLGEHGGTAGLITLEDILEEIVGEIVDEFDEDETDGITKIGTREVEASGKALVEQINEALDIRIPCHDHRTISYYITEKLGRFPKRGEIIKGRGYQIQVEEMHKHTILKVSVEKK